MSDREPMIQASKSEAAWPNAIDRSRPARATSARAVALLTGGADRPYAYGLTTALTSHGVSVDLIAGDELECPEFSSHPDVTFHNLRGSHLREAGVVAKVWRV